MTESTLTIDYVQLRRDLGRFLGYDRDPSNFTTDQGQDVTDSLRDGYQQFLYPPRLDKSKPAHSWNWLRPIKTINIWPTTTGTTVGLPVYSNPSSTVTASAAAFYPSMVGPDISLTFDTSGTSYPIVSYTSSTVILVTGDASSEASGDTYTITSVGDFSFPDEVLGVDGQMQYADTTAYRPNLAPRNPLQIYERRQAGSINIGTPTIYALRPRTFVPATGQRWDLMTFPTPDSVYQMYYRAHIAPDIIGAVDKYGIGGMPHSRTLKESCLACAELMLEDQHGPHYEAFLQALEASIDFDRRSVGTEKLGFNYDQGRGAIAYERNDLVKFSGTLYRG